MNLCSSKRWIYLNTAVFNSKSFVQTISWTITANHMGEKNTPRHQKKKKSSNLLKNKRMHKQPENRAHHGIFGMAAPAQVWQAVGLLWLSTQRNARMVELLTKLTVGTCTQVPMNSTQRQVILTLRPLQLIILMFWFSSFPLNLSLNWELQYLQSLLKIYLFQFVKGYGSITKILKAKIIDWIGIAFRRCNYLRRHTRKSIQTRKK